MPRGSHLGMWEHLQHCCKDENNPNIMGKLSPSETVMRPAGEASPAVTSSILGSLERMVETSFTSYSSTTWSRSPPMSEKSLLQRLGMAPPGHITGTTMGLLHFPITSLVYRLIPSTKLFHPEIILRFHLFPSRHCEKFILS